MKRSIHDHLRWGSTRLSRQWHTQGWFVHGKVCWWVRAVNTSATVLKRQRGSGRKKKPTHPVPALPLTRVVRTWEKQGPYWVLFCVSLGALHRECRVALAGDSHVRTQQQRGFSPVPSPSDIGSPRVHLRFCKVPKQFHFCTLVWCFSNSINMIHLPCKVVSPKMQNRTHDCVFISEGPSP